MTTTYQALQLSLPLSLKVGAGLEEAWQDGSMRAVLDWLREEIARTYSARVTITSPEDAFLLLFWPLGAEQQEVLRVGLLDTAHHVLGIEDVVRGSVNRVQVRIAEVFRAAVRRNATAIILAHNHPSGNPVPSPEDVALTREIAQAGRLLEVDVLDHLVIGGEKFTSMKRLGLF